MSKTPVQLFDVNALLALCLTSHQHHGAAHRYLAGLAGPWATCPRTEAGVVRLLLNPAVVGSAPRPAAVKAVVTGFAQDPRWRFLDDPTSLARPLIDTNVLMGHQQVTDLHLVNLVAHHRASLATFDAALMTWLAPTDRHLVTLIPA